MWASAVLLIVVHTAFPWGRVVNPRRYVDITCVYGLVVITKGIPLPYTVTETYGLSVLF